MEPKKESSEHEENGKKVERTTYDDPDTDTHAEEIKIESTTDKQERKPNRREIFLLLNQPLDLFHPTLFEHAGIIIFWFIDPFGDQSCDHFFGGERSQDFFSGLS